MTRRGILLVCLLAAAVVAPAPTAPAVADDDQDAARRAVETGNALPLDRILRRARSDHPGQVLGVEIETEHDRLIYELRILAPGGHINEWRYDARTGQPIAGRHPSEDKGND